MPDPVPLHAHGTTPAAPVCANCGAAVAAEIARVVGDNDGRVPRCRHCADGIARTTAAATSTAGQGDGLRVAAKARTGGPQG